MCFEIQFKDFNLIQEKIEEQIEEFRKQNYPGLKADLIEFNYEIKEERDQLSIYSKKVYIFTRLQIISGS